MNLVHYTSLYILTILICFPLPSEAYTDSSKTLKCYNSLHKLTEARNYELYEKRLKECLILAKDYQHKKDFLSQSLYLNLKTRAWWESDSEKEKMYLFFKDTYALKIKKGELNKAKKTTLSIAYEFIYLYSSRFLEKIAPKYVDTIFIEMEKRNFSDFKYIYDYFNFNIIHRNFAKAKEVQNNHPNLDFINIPEVLSTNNYNQSQAGFLSFKSQNILNKNNFKLKSGKRIIVLVSPHCPYTRDAMKEIRVNNDLLTVFQKYGLYLTPQLESDFEGIFSYNMENPETQFVLSVQDSKWKPITDLSQAFPIFYFLENGIIRSKLIGGDPNFYKAIKKGLKTINL